MDSRHGDIKNLFRHHIPDFKSIDPNHAKNLAEMLHSTQQSLYNCYETVLTSDLFTLWLNSDFDHLAKCAGLAFTQGLISYEQIASLLEIIDIKRKIAQHSESAEFLEIKIQNFFDEDSNFTNDALNLLGDFGINTKEMAEIFKNELLKKPPSERSFSILDIKVNDPKIQSLLHYAASFKIIKINPSANIERYFFPEGKKEQKSNTGINTCTFLSTGAKDALTKTLYGEHAKKLFPSAGKLEINDINEKMIEGGRYAAIAYPDIENESSFHDISASTFFLSLHDELHRRLISTIPNPLYYGLLHAINLVREKTGKLWSKEIWDSLDMDVDHFKYNPTQFYRDKIDYTEDFSELISANVASEIRDGGLFSPSAYNDTMWLLLIDMHINQETWKKLTIDPDKLLESAYRPYYLFIKDQLNESFINKSPAEQVAIIKSAWFKLPYQEGQKIAFVKKKVVGKNNYYLQVHVDGKPILASKETFMNLFRMHNLDFTSSSGASFLRENAQNKKDYFDHTSVEIKMLIENDPYYFSKSTLNAYHEQQFIALLKYLPIEKESLDSDMKYSIYAGLLKAVNNIKINCSNIITTSNNSHSEDELMQIKKQLDELHDVLEYIRENYYQLPSIPNNNLMVMFMRINDDTSYSVNKARSGIESKLSLIEFRKELNKKSPIQAHSFLRTNDNTPEEKSDLKKHNPKTPRF